MEQTAYFLRRPRRIEDLRAEEDGRRRPYRVVSSLRLGGMDYENFVTDLLADWAFLENVPGCGEDGNVLCCLRVGCPGREDILVVLDGTGHVALAALA